MMRLRKSQVSVCSCFLLYCSATLCVGYNHAAIVQAHVSMSSS